MFRASYRTAQLDAFMRDTIGIDPAILTLETGLSAARIQAYQRQLGLRAITGNKRKGIK